VLRSPNRLPSTLHQSNLFPISYRSSFLLGTNTTKKIQLPELYMSTAQKTEKLE
jgi:hypothetical protein